MKVPDDVHFESKPWLLDAWAEWKHCHVEEPVDSFEGTFDLTDVGDIALDYFNGVRPDRLDQILRLHELVEHDDASCVASYESIDNVRSDEP